MCIRDSGNLVVQSGEDILFIDSRPSDSLALAVRAHVPILVSQGVLDLAGIVPERDLQSLAEEESAEEPTELESGDAKKRLSVFEDFLQNVTLENNDEAQAGPEEKTPPEPDK
jgi:bifunctional DNase/RNase